MIVWEYKSGWILTKESRDLKMEDILPNMQIGVMGFLALYGFVTLFQQIYGATIGIIP